MDVNQLSSTTERVFSALGVLAIGGGVAIVSIFNPTATGLFPQCPFHALTGLNCPGCGMTRGFNALFHGDILGALHFNALLPFYALIFGYLTLSLFLIATRGYGLTWNIFKPKVMYAFAIVAIIFAVTRNLPIYPFNLLAI